MFYLFLIAIVPQVAMVILMAFCVIGLVSGNLMDNFKHPSNLHRLAFEEASKPYPHIPVDKPKKPKNKFSKFFNPMALVKYAGTGAIGISGKIAGTVFTIGGSAGPFVRVWAKPKNRRSALQNLVRGVLSGISSSWQTLTALQIDAWNATAASDSALPLRKNVFGDSRKCSGSQLFQRINNIMDSMGLTLFTNPPVFAATDAITALTGAASAGGGTFTLSITTFGAAATLPALTYARVYATSQKSNGRNYFGKSQYRLNAFYPPTTAITPLNIFAAYVAQFGALTVGSKIGIIVEFIYADTVGGNFSKGGKVYTTVTVAP